MIIKIINKISTQCVIFKNISKKYQCIHNFSTSKEIELNNKQQNQLKSKQYNGLTNHSQKLLKKEGIQSLNGSAVTPLPKIQFPFRYHQDNQDGLRTKDLYQSTGYTKHDRLPKCNYYALQYKGRVHHVFNAYYYPLGKMVTKISNHIRGKYSPLYQNSKAQPQQGDICVIVNAQDPLLTGKKMLNKKFRYHTGFIGHLRTHSYRSVLNKKPQLLYYYLLRKCMPKNRLSQKYMENVKIYRGPVHDLKHLPQFAPDRNIYDLLPQIDFIQKIKENPQDFEIFKQTTPGMAQKFLEKQTYDKIPKKSFQQAFDFDFSQQFKQKQPTKMVPNVSNKQYKKLLNHQKRMEQRYKVYRAPYKKKLTSELSKGPKGFEYFDDQRKAKKHSEYQMLADQDLPQDDEEVIEDVFKRKRNQKQKDNKENKKDDKKK